MFDWIGDALSWVGDKFSDVGTAISEAVWDGYPYLNSKWVLHQLFLFQ